MEAKLQNGKLTSHMYRKGKRGKPLTEQAKGSNRTKSKVRVCGSSMSSETVQTNDMGGTLVCAIDIVGPGRIRDEKSLR